MISSAEAPHIHDVLILGTGFAGLGMGIKLLEAGIDDFAILEKNEGVGGTWRDNNYPGAACDVQSHLYSFSFAPNPKWSRQFGEQAEILAYLEGVTDEYGLRPFIRFETEVVGARYHEARGIWSVETGSGETLRARAVVSGCGPLNRPMIPNIAGLDDFDGALFHSARWDHDVDLHGKRVAIIGTGASAIQVVPAIVDEVESLTVFQRTAPWVLPKPDRALTKMEKRLFERFPRTQWLARQGIYWSLEWRAALFTKAPKGLELLEGPARAYLKTVVPDASLRSKVTPKFRMGCKRILMSNEYYQALGRAHVEVVSEGIERVAGEGVITRDGARRDFDVVVFCTGFHASENVAPFPIAGRRGDLGELWDAEGAEAYKGTTVNGYPNLFLMIGPNTGLGHSSMVFIIESQIHYIVQALRMMRERRLKSVEVKKDAQDLYNVEIQKKMEDTVWATGCQSWYQTRDGKNTTLWPGFTFAFRAMMRRFDADAYELIAERVLN